MVLLGGGGGIDMRAGGRPLEISSNLKNRNLCVGIFWPVQLLEALFRHMLLPLASL